MGLEAGDPLLLLEGRGTDQHGRPLEVFATWHRADQIAFDIDVSDETSTFAVSGVLPIGPRQPPAALPRRSESSTQLERAAELAHRVADLLDGLTQANDDD